MRFLADESCDAAVVAALRASGHDVLVVAEIARGADDDHVISLASRDQRILLTEDKDFGQLVFAAVKDNSGVVLIRFPQTARASLGKAIVDLIDARGAPFPDLSPLSSPGRFGSRSSRSSPVLVARP